MEGGVRRNIALKLKDTAPQRSPSDGVRKKEAVKESSREDAPHPPPHHLPSSPTHTVTEAPKPAKTHLPPPPPIAVATTTVPPLPRPPIVVGSKKVAPEGIVEVGSSLRWDYKPRILGRPIQDPLIHMCEVCSLPVLIYGRMKRCRHAFCRDCAKHAQGVCPCCADGNQTFEEASMGNVYICTYGGGRYDNKGCGRSYLSQRDLEAHITYRHKDKNQMPPPPPPPPPPGLSLSSQSALPSLHIPPFFTMPGAGLPHNFSIPGIPGMPPHPSISRPGVQPMFPPSLPPVFVSQPNTDGSVPVSLAATWTTAHVFK